MGIDLLIVAQQHSQARGHAYALIQSIAGDIPGDEREDDRRYSFTDDRLIVSTRLTMKQFETARRQLRRLGELVYWPDEARPGYTVYQILRFRGERP